MHDDQRDLERLRAVAPRAVATPGPADDRARAALRDAARSERSARERRGSRRIGAGWRRVAVAIGVTAAAATGVAATHLDLSPPNASAGIVCALEIARTPSGAVVPPSTAPYTTRCGRVWADAHPGVRATPDQFTACRSKGEIYVYRARSDVCSQLGLPTADEAPSPADQQAIAFMNALGRRIAASGCVPLADARGIVHDELDKARLAGWQTRATAPRSTDERCATLAFDSATRTVGLIPMRLQDVTR